VSNQHPIQNLLDFIDASPSPWHVVATIESVLAANGFERLDETINWQIKPDGRYYVVRGGSSIIFFIAGSEPLRETGFRIVGAHTDSPGLRVKPNPISSKHGLLRLNVEIYGSPILATFTDRDLSLAGRVCYKNNQDKIETSLIRFDEPILRLPNLAIHMNRNVNEDGLKFHKQDELPLTFSALAEQELSGQIFPEFLNKKLPEPDARILSWDLAIYDTQKGSIWGANGEFFCAARIDNLASCHAALQALVNDENLIRKNTSVCAFFDHEEIGSTSNKGADGSFLPDVLHRISTMTQPEPQHYAAIMANSFLISADMAHAYHPNFPSAYDPDHKVVVNQGPAIKTNVNQRYSSEGISEAMFIDWCQQAGVPFQRYAHRSDLPCGSTIGPVTSAKLGLRSIDVGNPMWSMHSIRESAGVNDHTYMILVLKTFFST
jgi:aspartyl aminopeptidase